MAANALLVVGIVFALSTLPETPEPHSLDLAAVEPSNTPVAEPTAGSTPTPPEPFIPEIPAGDLQVMVYHVVEGDTLLTIAEQFGVTPSSIFEVNQLVPGDTLFPGRELLIPPPTFISAYPPPPGSGEYILAKEEQVSLRADRGTEYEILGELGIGDRLQKIGEITDDGWVAVEYPAGSEQIAWVWNELVIVVDPSDVDRSVFALEAGCAPAIPGLMGQACGWMYASSC